MQNTNYFNFLQPYQHHLENYIPGVGVYSFSINPCNLQPSGSCNFSRFNTTSLKFKGWTGPTIENIYAVNYNVLRINSGLVGIVYSN